MREEDDQLYIYKLYGLSTPRLIKADKSLRNRIGPQTTITEDQISKAQRVIDNPRADFKQYAMEHIRKIRNAIEMARQETYMHDSEFDMVAIPLIQIKGQAAMFGNPLASEVSAMLLKFIEHYKKLDSDMLDILDAYCRIVTVSYDQRYFNIETPGGRNLVNELSAAMQRYTVKFKEKTGR